MEHQTNQQAPASLNPAKPAALVQYAPTATPLATYYPPLEAITKPGLTTCEAGYYLDRKPQTMRAWACREDGPLRPVRINGRLAWPTSAVKALVGVAA
jgi:hypothetical protein